MYIYIYIYIYNRIFKNVHNGKMIGHLGKYS